MVGLELPGGEVSLVAHVESCEKLVGGIAGLGEGTEVGEQGRVVALLQNKQINFISALIP